jgi:hypothetical protein
MKYVHRFTRSLSCEVEVADQPPPQGTNHILAIVWDGQRKAKHHPEYLRWMHFIHSDCANRWNKKFMQAVQLPDQSWQFWVYVPGQAPRRLENP